MEWQPIETAPKDGDAVLLWSDLWAMTWGIQLGFYMDGKWYCGEGEVAEDETEDLGDDIGEVNAGPTHWMPLPDPPADEAP